MPSCQNICMRLFTYANSIAKITYNTVNSRHAFEIKTLFPHAQITRALKCELARDPAIARHPQQIKDMGQVAGIYPAIGGAARGGFGAVGKAVIGGL